MSASHRPDPENKSRRGIWVLEYGPCWCRGRPGPQGSFNLIRLNSTTLEERAAIPVNVVVIPPRVIDGARGLFLQVLEQVETPRIVIASAVCPHTGEFWEDLAGDWTPAGELFEVDVTTGACLYGKPEELIRVVLETVGHYQNDRGVSRGREDAAASSRTTTTETPAGSPQQKDGN